MVTPAIENRRSGSKDNNIDNSTDNNLQIIKDIHNLLLKEIQIPTLQSIPFDTYQNIASIVEDLKGQEYEGIEAKIRDSIVEMISISARLMLETRLQKLKGQQNNPFLAALSSSSAGNMSTPIDYSKLTDDEKYILDSEKESQKRRFIVLVAMLKGRPKVLESISSKIHRKQIIIRFIKSMEQFIAVDMNKYGPFQEEDVAILPFENARSLIENGEAIEIHAMDR
jgi:DNA replication factor GINS